MSNDDVRRTRAATTDRNPTSDASIVRSEERLLVATETVPVARVRLRKYLVTEERTFTVPVTREEVELDYADVPEHAQVPDGAALTSDDLEVVRYEERVVVTKEVVAVERVRLVRRVVTADQLVTGQVRRELVEVDRLDGRGDGTP